MIPHISRSLGDLHDAAAALFGRSLGESKSWGNAPRHVTNHQAEADPGADPRADPDPAADPGADPEADPATDPEAGAVLLP